MIRYQTLPIFPHAQPLPSCRAALVNRMAGDMREMAFAGQTVSSETLVQMGWTLLTVKRLAPDAIALARRQSVRRIA